MLPNEASFCLHTTDCHLMLPKTNDSAINSPLLSFKIFGQMRDAA
jgi:hypothetical protein